MAVLLGRPSLRVWALLLLVLAASPVTAPFSSCDLQGLLFDSDHLGTVLKSKTASDKTIPDLSAHHALTLPAVSAAPAAGRVHCHTGYSGIHRIPLRI